MAVMQLVDTSIRACHAIHIGQLDPEPNSGAHGSRAVKGRMACLLMGAGPGNQSALTAGLNGFGSFEVASVMTLG